MIQHSIVQERSSVPFPAFTGERVYMQAFYKAQGLPPHLERWQNTVDAMLEDVDTDGPIYLMVDQGIVKANTSHRRPGLHVDGYWNPLLRAHGGSGGHVGCWDGGGWATCDFSHPEALILASDVSSCRAMVGSWDGTPSDGGDCSHISTTGMEELILEAGKAYAGNVTMLHESLPVCEDTQRTLVRLSVPGWHPKAGHPKAGTPSVLH